MDQGLFRTAFTFIILTQTMAFAMGSMPQVTVIYLLGVNGGQRVIDSAEIFTFIR
ncbi:hypothetical protein EYZ11_012004 [Aspergillus tanneri]|uniref:Uncharacterized protein n=1 Tax=Aspergillus tanneri TaxID=1220188 RepID=A0A4V3UMT6_9EURO|nr:hypothetical protein EYZ11_012004 [Aspergillus tanneri]